MTVTIDLRPDVEATLAAQAARQGISLAQYLGRLIEDQLPSEHNRHLPGADRAAAWRNAVKQLPRTPPLSDDAISRESIYNARG